MKWISKSRRHSWLLAAAGLLVLAALVFFILPFARGKNVPKTVNTAVDGVNLTYLNFDQNNQKRMEVRCLEAQQHDNERMRMRKISATIFKSGKIEKEIRVTAEAGIVSNNLFNFEISDQARIYSADFSLSSERFTLQNREKLSSPDRVEYELQNISGTAAAGLDYFLDQNLFKLFETRGTLVRNGKPYAFYAQTLWVIKKSNLIIFQNRGELAGDGATVRGNWFSLQFNNDFASLQTTLVSGNCFFGQVEPGTDRSALSREITADAIEITYDPEGRLKRLLVTGAGRITLQDKKSWGRITGEIIEIFFQPETQTLEKVHVRKQGSLTRRGLDNFTMSGDSLLARYSSAGVFTEVKADDNCEFSTDELRGTADFITYDAKRRQIDIRGSDAAIFSKKNIFNSSHFLIDNRKRQLHAVSGVKATILPEEKSVLLSSKPLFITATAMEMTEQGNAVRFKEKVKLFQDDIELHAGEMVFNSRNGLMFFSGHADLKFVNQNELIVLRGQTISFATPERRVVITGNASLQLGENTLTGRQIELVFGPDDQLEIIFARDNVVFNRKDLSGKCGSLHWHYIKKTILFKNSAQISRKNAGTTRGRELFLDLNSNEITVSSREERAETVINPDR